KEDVKKTHQALKYKTESKIKTGSFGELYLGSLEDIPSSNQTKIEYLYTSKIKMQVKDKVSSSK
ncbi:hypothetical protein Tco_0304074, partial [Tanacetum coccineum]